jgi:hypothetical protein
MKCKDIQELFIEYIDGVLSSDETLEVDEHISSCEACSNELACIKSLCLNLNNIELEQPSEKMKNSFNSMVNNYIQGMDKNVNVTWYKKAGEWMGNWWPKRPLIQITATITVLIIGIVTGLNINKNNVPENEIVQLKTDVDHLRQTVMNSLLNQSSVSDRINGLTMASRLKNVNDQFYSTLLLLLNSDPNVNVRLAAVNALSKHADDQYVRTELVKSLGLQSSPLVQISLIDLLNSIQEYDSYPTLMEMIDNPNTNNLVKKRAKSSLTKLVSFEGNI